MKTAVGLVAIALFAARMPALAQRTAMPPEVAAHLGSAVRLMQDRQYNDAAAEFEKALALDPNNDAVRIQYATCLFAEERNEEAREQFETERKRLGDRDGLVYFLGILDVRAENYAAAIAKLKPLASNAGFPKAPFYLGLAYLANGERTQALEYLEQAAQAVPRDPDVHYRLGRVYSLAGRAADAEREYRLYRQWHESQQLAEEDGRSCMDALRAQSIEKAREICNKIADPSDSRRLIFLGQLYSDVRAFADAIDPLERAVKLDPKSFEAWHYLGLSLYGLHRYGEAVQPLETAASLNPQYFDTVNLLAKAYHLLGNDRAALPYLERAHQLNPADRNVTEVLEQMRAVLKPK
jgi:tetratricopeptide (TPR) repeat protein